jgi:hypothetical protein
VENGDRQEISGAFPQVLPFPARDRQATAAKIPGSTGLDGKKPLQLEAFQNFP